MRKKQLFWVLLPCLLLLACQPGPTNTDKLFKQNFLPYPNVLVKLDTDTIAQDARENFFLAYRNKNYQQSLRIANEMSDLPNEDPLQLYRSVCMMALGDFKNAITVLKELAAQPGDYQDAARWYWSLALLKLGDINACKDQLITLRNTSTYIRNEAKVLIGKLQ